MKKFQGLMTSWRDDWRTPISLFKELNKEFNFNFDPCPNNPTFDGLSIDWGERTFCNPPYGRTIGLWLKKGYDEWQKGKLVVFLIPSRTDTKWFHSIILPNAKEIRFIKGRLHFSGHKNSAPFPSMLVIFSH